MLGAVAGEPDRDGEEVVLRAVVPDDQGRVDPGPLRDPADGRSFQSVLAELDLGGFEDLLCGNRTGRAGRAADDRAERPEPGGRPAREAGPARPEYLDYLGRTVPW
nr:hypothetical protein [Saccharopolyspora gloriosae]